MLSLWRYYSSITVIFSMKSGIMRKWILLAVMIIAISRGVSGQIIQGALIFGGNLSQVDGDEVYGFNNLGFNAGAAAIMPFGNNWSMTIEALYSQKGAHRKKQFNVDDETRNGSYDYDLSYGEIPVLIQYTDKDVMTFGAGLSYGRLIDYQEIDHRDPGYVVVEYDSPPSIHNVEVLGDIRFRVYEKLKMNFRYSYSLFSFRDAEFNWTGSDHPEERQQYHSVITWRMIWVINERQSKRTQKETEIYNR